MLRFGGVKKYCDILCGGGGAIKDHIVPLCEGGSKDFALVSHHKILVHIGEVGFDIERTVALDEYQGITGYSGHCWVKT